MENGKEEVADVNLEDFRTEFDPIMASVPKKSKLVSEVDRLRYQVLHLQLEKLNLEVSNLTMQLAERGRSRQDIVAKAEDVRKEYQDKYGIDIWTGKINEDGTFTAQAQALRPPSGS